MEPCLTVIIPACNCEKTILRALGSLDAGGEDLEILVIDDGSRDRTGDLAREFCASHGGRVIRQENRGHGGAINRGVREAGGTYLKVLDGDDWLDRENLPKLLQFLRTCTWDLVLTDYEIWNQETGRISPQRADPKVCRRQLDPAKLLQELHSFRPVLSFHGLTCRRDFYRSLRLELREGVYYEDFQYFLIPLCCAGTLGALDLTLYHYRVGGSDQSISRENRCRRLSHRQTVLEALLGAPEIWPRLREPERRALYERLLRSFLITWLSILLLDLGDRRGARALIRQLRPWSPGLSRQLVLPALLLGGLSRLGVTQEQAEAWLERQK